MKTTRTEAPMIERFHLSTGVEMHCELRGEGEPLLLLHGFMGCGANWRLVFPDAPAGFRLIAPDLRGHGRSTNPDAGFSFHQAALDVVDLLRQLGVPRTRAMGVSGGGQTLLGLATMEPERVEAMVVVSAAHYFPEPARVIMRQTTPESAPAETWQMMRSFHPGGDEQIRRLWQQAHDFAEGNDPCFAPHQLAAITARTLIVHGDADPFYPLEVIDEMRRAIPGAELWVIPGAGHGPIFGAQRAVFVERALPFLRGPGERAGPVVE